MPEPHNARRGDQQAGLASPTVRLAVYHPWVYLKGGAERVLCELLRRSRHDWTVVTHHFERASTFPELSGHRVVEVHPRVAIRRTLIPVATAAALISSTRLELPGSRGCWSPPRDSATSSWCATGASPRCATA